MRDPVTGTFETDASLGTRFLEHLNKRVGDFRKYDSILIDEAQDFHPTWFSCILAAMKDPDDGDLLIVCDGNQGIRPIETITWKSLGIKASGRSMHRALDLDKNYRNTYEILKLASNFALNEAQHTDDSFGIIPVNPAQAKRHGPKPYLIRCTDHSDECKHVVQIVKDLLKGQLPSGTRGSAFKPEEIGIIYRRSSAKEKELLTGMREEISHYAPVIWLSENYLTRSQVLEPGVKIQTVDSAKGLQYRAVIILWPDLFRPFNHNDESLEKRRFYVALTRAEDLVILASSKSNKYIEILEKSGDIIRIPPLPSDSDHPTKAYSMEETRSDFPKAYVKWTQEEDEHLNVLYRAGENTKRLAKTFQRKESAILARLEKLGLK
jgi:superfamily I DNA/RNA helicase